MPSASFPRGSPVLKRFFAVLTTAVLALGLALGAAAPASAHIPSVTPTCTGITVKFQAYGANTTNTVRVTIDGVLVENSTFGNNFAEKAYAVSPTTASHTYVVEVDAEHNQHDRTVAGGTAITGTWIPCASTALTCDVATLYKGSPLSNGDHINMDVVIGGVKQQVNAYVDLWQTGGPTPKLSNFVLNVTPKSGPQFKVSIPQANIDSGILAFEYSSGWTGSWTVEWVQYNSSYFNQDRNAGTFLHCQKDIPVAISTVPSATAPTCDADGALVVPNTANITWSGGTNGDGPGTYTLVATPASGYTLNGAQDTWVIQVLPKGTDLSCGPPPCIAASDVSYTYNPATNSGVVTVANPAGSSGKLCNGFWVTAVSWKYAGSGVWPQNLDKNNPMPENGGSFFVDEPGSYPYGADVVCGQGDIYASYDAQPVPTAVLNGPNNPYAEHFLHQMGFSGPNPTWVQNATGCNTATPVAPIATPITACDTDGSLTFGPTTGVVYSLTAGNGTSGAWEVTATPATNYYFDGPQVVTFSGDLGTPTDCANPTAPAITQAVCDTATGIVTSGFITVPSTTGLDYRLGTTLLTPGSKVELGAGDYTITVTEQPGYTNTGAGSFPVSIANVPTCDDPVEYVVPAVQHEICDAATGVISGAELTFTAVEHITYYLDGTEVVFPVGETAVTLPVVAGDHTVTYESASGYYLKGTALLTSTTETVTVETPADCDDPVEYVKPAVTHETCDNVLGGEKDGTITFTLPENLTYVFDGTEVTPADLTIEKPAGSYSLVVTADPGFFITGGGTTETFTITVEPAIDCDDVTIIPLDPFASPEQCVAGSLDGDKKDGTITIVKAEHVTWQISNDRDGVKHAVDTSGAGPNFVFDYPAGDYHVWATADPGYFITTPTSFALTVHEPTLDCDLPTFAQLPTGAGWTQAVCTATGIVDPTITVEPFVGVSYFLDGVEMTQTTVTVKPGTYSLTASADDPTNTVTTATWPPIVLVAASGALCTDLTTLALTGETPGGWLILALVLLQAGLVLVAVRFVRGRQTARLVA
jgi:hypothetical protein